jgi:hypothetical protein
MKGTSYICKNYMLFIEACQGRSLSNSIDAG